MAALWNAFDGAGATCRASFDREDMGYFLVAKNLWHVTVFLPLMLYFLGLANDASPRFPITISWTCRRGLGRIVFHLAWIAGWVRFLAPLLKHRDACFWNLAASLQMWATGFFAMSFSPVGVSASTDLRHFRASGKYMVDHAIMMQLFAVEGNHARGFVAAGLVFGVATSYLKIAKARHGEDIPAGASNDFRVAQRAKLGGLARLELGAVELVEMVSEYAIFMCFVSGIPSATTVFFEMD